MSFPKPPVVVSSVALLAALSVLPTGASARDGGRGNTVYEIPPMSPDGSHEIIYIMPPLKPVPGMAKKAAPAPAVAAQPAPAPVKEAAPVQPAPAPVAEAPKPADAQPPVAEAPKPADPAQAVAEAPQPAEASPPVAEAAQQGQPQAVAEQPQPAGAAPEIPPQAVAEAPQPQPQIVEPAPIGPPVMTLNPARKALAALKQPVVVLDEKFVLPQGDYVPPALVPALQSLAKSEASVEPAQAEAAPPGAEAAAQASVDAASANPEMRISALLAQGVAGPAEVRLADRATMWLPAGRVFIPLEPAKLLAKEAGLEWRTGVQGLIAPAGGMLQWLAPVELLDDGHIASGEAAALQPDALLAAFEAGLPEINAQRGRVGQPPVALGGWLSAPELTAKHRLSACVNIAAKNDQTGLDRYFNCEAWALGRFGAIKVALADGGEEAERLKNEAISLADTIVFDRGQTYEDFDAATDKAAPYAVPDMLTRDVTIQAAPPAPVDGVAAAPEESDLISKLLGPALFGVAALGLYAFMKRRKANAEADGEAESAPIEASVGASEAADEAPQSLFARMLPSLHARLAKQAAPVEAAKPAKGKAADFAEAGAEGSGAGSLMEKLSQLRAAVKKDEPAAAAPRAPASTLAAIDASSEPASALKKLAARMRRSTDEQPAPKVNVSRVTRAVRTLPGAAPAVAEMLDEMPEPMIVQPKAEAVIPEPKPEAVVEALKFEEPKLVEPGQSLDEPEPVEPELAKPEMVEPFAAKPEPEAPAAAPPVFDEDDFDLVEPGDMDAATAASDRARSIRQAQG